MANVNGTLLPPRSNQRNYTSDTEAVYTNAPPPIPPRSNQRNYTSDTEAVYTNTPPPIPPRVKPRNHTTTPSVAVVKPEERHLQQYMYNAGNQQQISQHNAMPVQAGTTDNIRATEQNNFVPNGAMCTQMMQPAVMQNVPYMMPNGQPMMLMPNGQLAPMMPNGQPIMYMMQPNAQPLPQVQSSQIAAHKAEKTTKYVTNEEFKKTPNEEFKQVDILLIKDEITDFTADKRMQNKFIQLAKINQNIEVNFNSLIVYKKYLQEMADIIYKEEESAATSIATLSTDKDGTQEEIIHSKTTEGSMPEIATLNAKNLTIKDDVHIYDFRVLRGKFNKITINGLFTINDDQTTNFIISDYFNKHKVEIECIKASGKIDATPWKYVYICQSMIGRIMYDKTLYLNNFPNLFQKSFLNMFDGEILCYYDLLGTHSVATMRSFVKTLYSDHEMPMQYTREVLIKLHGNCTHEPNSDSLKLYPVFMTCAEQASKIHATTKSFNSRKIDLSKDEIETLINELNIFATFFDNWTKYCLSVIIYDMDRLKKADVKSMYNLKFSDACRQLGGLWEMDELMYDISSTKHNIQRNNNGLNKLLQEKGGKNFGEYIQRLRGYIHRTATTIKNAATELQTADKNLSIQNSKLSNIITAMQNITKHTLSKNNNILHIINEANLLG